MDLRELLLSWLLALKAEDRAPNTLTVYRTGVERYLDWCTAQGLPEELDRPQVRAWTAEILDAGAETSTAAARQSAVRRFSRWLFEEDEQDSDPLDGLKPVSQDQKLVNPLTEDELTALLKTCSGKTFENRRDLAVIRVLMDSGLRPGEVAELRLENIDLGAGIITVPKSKGKKGKITHIGPRTCAAVDAWLRVRRTHKLAAGPLLWLGTRGREFHYPAMWLALKGRAADAGITRRFHPHLFRHTKGTRWLAAGGSEGGLQASMGWSSRKMLDRYVAATAAQRAVEESKQLNLGDLG